MRGFSAVRFRKSGGDRSTSEPTANPLQTFFDARTEGPGIWKWTHYFDIYHRHLSKFVDDDVQLLEIGIYSGGSLEMWRDYLGSKCLIYGVDIEESCRAYEDDVTKVFIGDQEDRAFWGRFRSAVPTLHVVIDDGGHEPEQQIVSLEELLPHLAPGGVYICEDVHGVFNDFASYISGFVHNLNAVHNHRVSEDPERRSVTDATGFQSAIYSVHLYPYVVVIERTVTPVQQFCAPKHGTKWKPFLE